MTMLPTIVNYQRHVIICAGKTCDSTGDRTLVHYLKSELEARGIGSDRVRVNRAGCLGVCTQGAIMCIYPEAVWYCRIDQASIDRIIDTHLIGGDVVTDLVMHRNQYDAPMGSQP
ncbi:MAG: NAD(P)H-dependent oxidoreductase subunit E [Mariprofundales bacterium]|nr:NAD(P)H-dependent oxidoreductase subunit E [Mariprofundales bacterium]